MFAVLGILIVSLAYQVRKNPFSICPGLYPATRKTISAVVVDKKVGKIRYVINLKIEVLIKFFFIIYRRGGFHQPYRRKTNNIINPPPPNE